MKQLLTAIIALCLTSIAIAQSGLPNWALGPFIRPANVNPILSPDPKSTFPDPMK